MRKNDLIAALAAIPGNPVVALLNETQHEASPEAEQGTTDGIYPDMSVRLLSREEVPAGQMPWIAIQYSGEKEREATA